MIRLLRQVSLQTRLMALFVIPGLIMILSIPLLVSQYKDLLFLIDQQGIIDLAFVRAVHNRFTFTIFLFVLVVLVLFTLTLILGRSILVPLDNIRSSLTAFQIGRHTRLLNDESRDEFSELTRSLNRLVKQLSESYAGLEERIDQRTQALAQRASYLQAAAELARDTTSTADIDDLLDRSVALIRDRFSLYFVGVYLLDPTSNQAILRSGTGEIGKALIKRGHRYPVGEVGLVGQAVGRGESLIENDVNSDFAYQRHQLLEKTAAQVVLPLKIGNQIIGAVDIHSEVPNSFDTSEVSVLQIMADQLSVAIQNAILGEDLKIRIQETNMLYQRYAHENWSLSNLRESEIGYEFDRIRIMQYWEKIPEELIRELQKGKPITVSIPDQDNGNQKQILYAPLMMYNQLIGTIGLEQSGEEKNFTPDEITTLEAISNQISLALDNSRLLEETQRRSDQIRLLQGVTAIAASQVVLEDLLTDVAEKLQKDLLVDFCDVLWFEQDGISASYIVISTDTEEADYLSLKHASMPVVDNPLFQHLLDTNRSLGLYDLEHNPLAIDILEMAVQRNLSSVMVTPLILRGEVNGAILLCNRDKSRRFTNEELSLMDQISLQLSSALDVARTFEQTSQRAERERKISEASRRIRETLDLPTILRSAAQELRRVLDVPDVTIRFTPSPENSPKPEKET